MPWLFPAAAITLVIVIASGSRSGFRTSAMLYDKRK
jgi:hypothetical protein